jgi:hypothetical protein
MLRSYAQVALVLSHIDDENTHTISEYKQLRALTSEALARPYRHQTTTKNNEVRALKLP